MITITFLQRNGPAQKILVFYAYLTVKVSEQSHHSKTRPNQEKKLHIITNMSYLLLHTSFPYLIYQDSNPNPTQPPSIWTVSNENIVPCLFNIFYIKANTIIIKSNLNSQQLTTKFQKFLPT